MRLTSPAAALVMSSGAVGKEQPTDIRWMLGNVHRGEGSMSQRQPRSAHTLESLTSYSAFVYRYLFTKQTTGGITGGSIYEWARRYNPAVLSSLIPVVHLSARVSQLEITSTFTHTHKGPADGNL